LQDINGVRNASIEVAGWYATAGYTVYYPDYFDGGARDNNNPAHSLGNVTTRVVKALAVLRQMYPSTTIQATGYCFGGGVGVNLLQSTDPNVSVDSGVFAHASGVTPALVAGIQRPVSWVMPQSDNSFNVPAPRYLNTTTINGVEAQYKTYPNTTHGFAVTVSTVPWLVTMKLRAYHDTVWWLNNHRTVGSSWPITPPTPATSSTGSVAAGSSSSSSSSTGSGSSTGGYDSTGDSSSSSSSELLPFF